MGIGSFPFSDFLDVLRREGVVVDLRSEETVAKLLLRWRDLNRADLRTALASLLGQGDEGVSRVKSAFDCYFSESPEPPMPSPIAKPQLVERGPTRSVRSLWPFGAALMALVIAIGIGALMVLQGGHVELPDLGIELPDLGDFATLEPKHPEELTTLESGDLARSEDPTPSLPPLPRVYVPERKTLVRLLSAVTTVFLLAFLLFYSARRGRMLRAQAMLFYRSLLAQCPGPTQYTVPLPPPPPPLSRNDMEDAATLLCRLCVATRQGHLLDVATTVQNSAKSGCPVLHHHLHGTSVPILVLIDRGSEMGPYLRKIDMLLNGLITRGVPLVRWFFDGDADALEERESWPLVPLSALLRLHSGSPVLVVSTGQGIMAEAGRYAPWVVELSRLSARSFLHPVADPEWWRPDLRRPRFPLRVWPLSRQGLRGMAHDLATNPDQRLHVPRWLLQPRRRVGRRDVDIMYELVSLWPTVVDLEQADWLRRIADPDIPEEVLRALLRDAEDPTSGLLKLPHHKLEQGLDRLRCRDALEEKRLRGLIFERITAARPAEEGSQAYLRWRKDCAWAALYLDDEAAREAALRELEDLAAGPLWEDVDDDRWRLQRLPLPPPVTRRIEAGVERILARQAGGALPPGVSTGASWMTGLRLWQPILALLPALLVGLLWVVASSRTLPHLDGYRLSNVAARLTLEVRMLGVPLQAGLYQDGRLTGLIRSGTEIPIGSARAPRRFNAWAELPTGQVVYSRIVTVPGEAPKTSLQVFVRDASGRDVPGATCALRGSSAVQCSVGAALIMPPGEWEVNGVAPGYRERREHVSLVEGATKTVVLGPSLTFPPSIVWHRVRAAPFIMGSNDMTPDERPRHLERSVTKDFEMMETEVTVAMYQACVEAKHCSRPIIPFLPCNYGKDDRAGHPMNCVSFKDAQGFCRAIGGRLPKETEWELAARGIDGREYPWGQPADPAGRACHERNSAQGTCPVGKYENGASPFGLLDMSGNVWEITSSPYCKGSSIQRCSDPSNRVVRGGSWNLEKRLIGLAYRWYYAEVGEQSISVGFRCTRLP